MLSVVEKRGEPALSPAAAPARVAMAMKSPKLVLAGVLVRKDFPNNFPVEPQ